MSTQRPTDFEREVVLWARKIWRDSATQEAIDLDRVQNFIDFVAMGPESSTLVLPMLEAYTDEEAEAYFNLLEEGGPL